jgi:hypothetical protein
MSTIALKTPQTVHIDNKLMQDRIVVAIEAIKNQAKRLSWLIERQPGFVERNLLDEHLGHEVRRSSW